MDKEEDSLLINANTLKAEFDSTGENRILKAYKKVKFYREDLQGNAIRWYIYLAILLFNYIMNLFYGRERIKWQVNILKDI